MAEKEQSVAEFKVYKAQIADKERRTEEEHARKLKDCRT